MEDMKAILILRTHDSSAGGSMKHNIQRSHCKSLDEADLKHLGHLGHLGHLDLGISTLGICEAFGRAKSQEPKHRAVLRLSEGRCRAS